MFYIVEMMDFSLLSDLRFDVIAVLSMFIMLGYLVPFAFSSVRAKDLNIEENKASFLIFILGKSFYNYLLYVTTQCTSSSVPTYNNCILVFQVLAP